MRRIAAIALITVRTALRSKVVLALLGLMALLVISLPLTIKGDGTLGGYVQILLNYTLGFVVAILSVTSLWSGCGSISQEIQDKQMQLLVTKPVYRAEIWFGKWFGLLVINAALLLAAGSLTLLMLGWNTRAARLSEADRAQLNEEILVARASAPALPLVEGGLEAETRAASAGVGQSVRWTFELPEKRRGKGPLFLRYKLASSERMAMRLAGCWRDRAQGFEAPVQIAAHQFQTVRIPAELVSADGSVTLEFENVNAQPLVMTFDVKERPELLYYAGGFAGNYVTMLFLLLCHLSLMSAIGVTLGTFFTMPVAVFCSVWVLFLIASSRMIQEQAAQPPSEMPRAQHAVSRAYFRSMNVLVRPLKGDHPLEWIASGREIPSELQVRTLWIKGVVYPLLLAAMGMVVFERKEIAAFHS
jgi:hypothetical protein